MSIIDRPGEVFFMQNLHIHGYDVGVDSWEQMCAASVQADKVVNVRMSESEHTLLKAYCASLNRSMQAVLRDFALMQIQKQRFCCRLVRSLMDEHGIEQDPRARMPCFGYACYYCRHASPAWLVKLICFISPARRFVNWLLRKRLISSTLMAAVLRLPPRWTDRISIFQSLHPSMHEP